MKTLSLIALLWLSLCAPAKADYLLTHIGTAPGVAASYVGPGDVVAMSFWVGMRAYSAATRGMAAVNICSESGGVDVTCEDELTDAVTGKLVLGTIGSTCSSVPCTVKVWYDRTGNNFCSSAACNFTQTTVANRATFLITGCPGTGGQPCAQFNSALNNFYLTTGSSITPSPFSAMSVSERISGTNQVAIIFDPTTSSAVGYDTAASTALIYNGNNLTATASDGALHSIYGLFNGASSFLYVDGAALASGGAGSLTAELPADMGSVNSGSQFLNGYIDEVGFKAALLSGGNVTSLTTNQRTFWGF